MSGFALLYTYDNAHLGAQQYDSPHFHSRSTTLHWNPIKLAVLTFLGVSYLFLTALGHPNISRASILARWVVSPLLSLFSFWLALTLYIALPPSCTTIIERYTLSCDLAAPLVRCWTPPLPWWVSWFDFLTFLFITCPPLYPHMCGCSQHLRSIIYSVLSHMNGALDLLVSLYFIFYVFSYSPPCTSDSHFFAHYSGPYDSGRV